MEVVSRVIEEYGYEGPFPEGMKGVPARVLGAWGDYYRVVADEGEGLARRKSSAFRDAPPEALPVAGDFVALDWNPQGESRILAVLPRASSLQRATPAADGRRVQTLVANFDHVFFLTSANENFSVPRYERFLALADDSGCRARCVAVLTKTDLAPERTAEFVAALAEAAPEVPTLAVSAKTGEGMDALAPFAKPRRTLAFVGSSGVGKSSLVNALAGEFVADTCEIQEWSGKGRHTTTSRELLRLSSGVLAIDTPGLREFGAVDRTPEWSRKERHARRASDHRWRG